ncbi:MAG TPA: alpha/beta fold hydrolase [Acidimicrobiales bacterium]|nr:alpha/beta fold hydrolase [Acidimicrobiales bacterium]
MAESTLEWHYETRHVEVAPGVRDAVDTSPGSAPAFLCVHGLASNARLYDGVAAHLSEWGYAVASIDQRGHGRSDKPDDGYDFATLTADLVAIMADLVARGGSGWERPVVLGQSFGGNLVLELGFRHPELVRGVVCIDGGTIELADSFPDWDSVREALAPPRLSGMHGDRFESMIRTAHPDWPEAGVQGTLANMEVQEDGTITPHLSFDHHLAILRGLWQHRPSEIFPVLQVPALLIPAESPGMDSSFSTAKRESVSRAIASNSHTRVQWFSPADHDVHAQHPAEVAEVLRQAVSEGFFA